MLGTGKQEKASRQKQTRKKQQNERGKQNRKTQMETFKA
jgi:hypothetical protein